MKTKLKICIVGLGYVGLPLAVEFGKKFFVNGLDVNNKRISELKKNYDSNNEISHQDLLGSKIYFTNNPLIIKKSNFIIVAVPTPIDKANNPDLTLLINACQMIGKNLKQNSIIVFESTVYPGATEEICVPILEKEGHLHYNKDFKIGYSPERINPGDKQHTIAKVKKVVSGCDQETLKIIVQVYQSIVKAGVVPVKSIKIAEAAKVIENIQRDLNIAFMNELKMIFDKLNININDVLTAAKTKWNFLDFHPGLVGGHCIGVDPYYLAFKAKQIGHHPKLILAGRSVNNEMAKWEFIKISKIMQRQAIPLKNSKILILGAAFKPNVKDLRNSKVQDLINLFLHSGSMVWVCEPMITEKREIFNCPNISLAKINLHDFDFIVKAVNHDAFFNLKDSKIYNI